MTDRRAFIRAVSVGLLGAPFAAASQPAARIAHIGLIAQNSLTANPRLVEAFRLGLRELGYVEGRNIVIEYRTAEGRPERLPAVAAELVALKVDVIVTMAGTLSALAAKEATRTIPVVFSGVGDPVTSGLVTNLARPGGNVTGTSLLFPELIGKCLEHLKRAVPAVSRVALLLPRAAVPERAEKLMLSEAGQAAQALGLQLQVVEVRTSADMERAFSEMAKARAEALTVLSSPVLVNERLRLVNLATKNRLPTMFSFREYVDSGGLMSYGPDLADLFRRSATYVDKILHGAKPADLPVEQPTKFELIINLKTANALGLTIPPPLLARADELIR